MERWRRYRLGKDDLPDRESGPIDPGHIAPLARLAWEFLESPMEEVLSIDPNPRGVEISEGIYDTLVRGIWEIKKNQGKQITPIGLIQMFENAKEAITDTKDCDLHLQLTLKDMLHIGQERVRRYKSEQKRKAAEFENFNSLSIRLIRNTNRLIRKAIAFQNKEKSKRK